MGTRELTSRFALRTPGSARRNLRIIAFATALLALSGCLGSGSNKAGGSPERRSTPLDGVWEVTTATDDVIAVGSPEGTIPENWGKGTYVFDRGHFAITQENQESCSWGYGKLKVWGHRMQMLFIDGGETAGTGAMNRPDELFVFGWSLYREVLTLTPVKGAVSPGPFRAKPWTRVSTTPSRQYFSERCPPPDAALPR